MDDRVAFLCADPGIPPDGHKGASVHLRAMATALHRVGVALDVVVARAGSLAGFRPHRAQFVAPERARGLAGELRQIAHAEAMLAALQDCGPHRAVYERLSLFGLAGLLHARALGVPFVVEANAPLWREAARFRHLGLQHAARGVCRDVMQGADKVLAVSHALADELVREGVRADRVEVLGNGADLARFADAPKLTRPASLQGRPTMVFLGSLKPWHGIGFLLDAFAALRRRWPTCGLWIVGDGPERERVRRAVADADGAIVHTESVPHERVPSVLQAADVAVAPYTADAPSYFSPLKVVEVLAAGRPLLASRTPCVLEALRGHDPIGLFTPGDIDDFVAAAERLFRRGAAAGRDGIDARLVRELDWSHKAARVKQLLGLSETVQPTEGQRG